MLLPALVAACKPTAAPAAVATTLPFDVVARGQNLVKPTGCNDCHSPGYAGLQGNVEKGSGLTPSTLGYLGPWGTTCASGLRLSLCDRDEAQWLVYSARLRTRSRMPDFSPRTMDENSGQSAGSSALLALAASRHRRICHRVERHTCPVSPGSGRRAPATCASSSAPAIAAHREPPGGR